MISLRYGSSSLRCQRRSGAPRTRTACARCAGRRCVRAAPGEGRARPRAGAAAQARGLATEWSVAGVTREMPFAVGEAVDVRARGARGAESLTPVPRTQVFWRRPHSWAAPELTAAPQPAHVARVNIDGTVDVAFADGTAGRENRVPRMHVRREVRRRSLRVFYNDQMLIYLLVCGGRCGGARWHSRGARLWLCTCGEWRRASACAWSVCGRGHVRSARVCVCMSARACPWVWDPVCMRARTHARIRASRRASAGLCPAAAATA